MNGGIKYFRLHSPHKGDVTKNVGLTANDVDENFFTLEGRDIQAIDVEGRDIVITLLNGERLVRKDAIPADKSVSTINFDEKKGLLTYVVGNETKEVYLGTAHSTAVDDTLSGNGTKASPVSLARSMRPGQYRPVQKIVTGALDEARHCANKFKPGDRILTIEGISDYGMLYNYAAVQKIACELLTANSPWRIPTKPDWDDMLNAVEPCQDDRIHEIGSSNRYLGHWAGKILKSVDLWRSNIGCDCQNDEEDMPMFAIENDDACEMSPCMGDRFCGAASKPHPHPSHCHKPLPNGGIDKYGFRVTPAGSATDDACNFLHFSERAIFWTATNIKGRNVYVKQFAYNRNDVLQDIVATGKYLSLRLVKDYNGSNYNASEEILGQSYPTVLMPSKNKGASIWTAVNIAYNNCNLKALAPNNGLDLSETIHFFINEWDGEKWLRNELREGETVMVINTPEGDRYVEYAVIDNRLVNTNQRTFDKILDNVKETIESNNQVYEDRIGKLEEDTSSFKESTNENIKNLNESIDGVKEELDEKIESEKKALEEKIESEKSALEAKITEGDETLAKSLESTKDELSKAIVDGDTETNDRIDRLVDDIEKQNNSFTESIRATNEALTQAKEELADSISRNRAEVDKAIEDIAENVAEKVKETSDEIKAALKEAVDEVDKKYDEKTQEIDERIDGLSETVEENAKSLIVAEGTEYDPASGNLTLKTRGGEDDIVVPMSFNFGTF